LEEGPPADAVTGPRSASDKVEHRNLPEGGTLLFSPHRSSFPSSAWEREAQKLRFAAPTPDREPNCPPGNRAREAEPRGRAFPSRTWERGRSPVAGFVSD